MKSKKPVSLQSKPFSSIEKAMDALAKVTNRRRVVVENGSTFHVVSRPCARRVGLPVVARNF